MILSRILHGYSGAVFFASLAATDIYIASNRILRESGSAAGGEASGVLLAVLGGMCLALAAFNAAEAYGGSRRVDTPPRSRRTSRSEAEHEGENE